METIYFSLAKWYLEKYLRALSKKDASIGSNTELTHLKKRAIELKIEDLRRLEPQQSDAKNRKSLYDLLESLKETTRKHAIDHKHGEGETEPCLDQAQTYINSLLTDFNRAGVVDIPIADVKPDNPKAVFSYFYCRYSAKHLVEALFRNTELTTDDGELSISDWTPHVTLAKNDLFKRYVSTMIEAVEGSDSSNPNYAKNVRDSVLRVVTEMETELTKICSASATRKALPLNFFGVFGVEIPLSWGAGAGTFGKYIEYIRNMLKEGTPLLETLSVVECDKPDTTSTIEYN